jgi:hypothetical protein
LRLLVRNLAFLRRQLMLTIVGPNLAFVLVMAAVSLLTSVLVMAAVPLLASVLVMDIVPL